MKAIVASGRPTRTARRARLGQVGGTRTSLWPTQPVERLLGEAAQRLSRCVRESDTVGRLGGDEFAVLLPRINQPDDALAVAEKIRRELHQPFELDGHTLVIAASIGIALYPDHGESDDALLKLADDAMYAAKRRGGNRLLMSTTQPSA